MQANAKDFNCRTCQAKHCDHDGEIEGSVGAAGFPRFEVPGVMTSDVCFLPMISALSAECLRLFGHYKNGVLIKAGGLYDQPNRYIQAMGLIDNGTA